MAIVKMDEKGRIQLPAELREAWRLKPKQALVFDFEGIKASIRRLDKGDPASDPLLRDILIHPLRSKKKVTRALLAKLEEEQWSQ